jgi:hypothetical protein
VIALPLALIRNLSLWFDELFSVFFSAQGLCQGFWQIAHALKRVAPGIVIYLLIFG